MLAIDNNIPRIEHGIALPEPKAKGRKFGNSKFPFRLMKTGDSFFVPGKSVQRFYATIRYAEKAILRDTSKPVRFTIRKWKEGSVEGVRCWREK